jgi:hypothetical protein
MRVRHDILGPCFIFLLGRGDGEALFSPSR